MSAMHTNKSDDIKPRESISDELTVDIVVSANVVAPNYDVLNKLILPRGVESDIQELLKTYNRDNTIKLKSVKAIPCSD